MERKVYTEKEQIILATLVKKKGAAIENKRTDGTTLHNKNRAWEEITKQFNIQPEVTSKRTSQQLRKLWANLKQKKRKQTTKSRYEMLATGGGLPDKKVEDPVLALVDDAAPHVDVELDSVWDSTAVFESSMTALEEPKCKKSDLHEAIVVELSQGEDIMEEQIEFIIEEPNDHTGSIAVETPAKGRRICRSKNLANQQRLAEESALRIKN